MFTKNLKTKTVFLLRSKFSSFSTQQKWTVEKRNKTRKISASFCTKKHQNPFSSLGERVVWSCVGDLKNIAKTKTRRSCVHCRMVSLRLLIRNITGITCMIYVFLFLVLFWNHHCNFKQLVLQDYYSDFPPKWSPGKMIVCKMIGPKWSILKWLGQNDRPGSSETFLPKWLAKWLPQNDRWEA